MQLEAGPYLQALRTEVVAVYRGVLRSVIKWMKYDGEVGWAPLFGRLLARRLEQVFRPDAVDLVVPNPTHRSRAVRHTELILAACADTASSAQWRFDDVDDPCLVKTAVTPKSHGSDPGQRAASAEALYGSLVVARPNLVRNRRLVVVDDVVTTGRQLRAVQRRLLECGAASVEALVRARWARNLVPQRRGFLAGSTRPLLALQGLAWVSRLQPRWLSGDFIARHDAGGVGEHLLEDSRGDPEGLAEGDDREAVVAVGVSPPPGGGVCGAATDPQDQGRLFDGEHGQVALVQLPEQLGPVFAFHAVLGRSSTSRSAGDGS